MKKVVGDLKWSYDAECQLWTGELSRTVTLGGASATQVAREPIQNCRVKADPVHNVAESGEWISEAEATKQFVSHEETNLRWALEKEFAALVVERILARVKQLRARGLPAAALQFEEESLRSLFANEYRHAPLYRLQGNE